MRLVALAVIVAVGILPACAQGAGRLTVPAASPLPAASEVFVAEYSYGSGDTGGGHGTFLGVFALRTGRHLGDVVGVAEGGLTRLAGYARGADGDLWYALAHGPRYRSNVAGGDPAPDSCGGSVYRVDHVTGATHRAFTVGRDRTVSGPVPGPDGRAIAYLSQPCTSDFSTAVIVRDLTSGREHRIGVADAGVSAPGWSRDGTQIIFTVMFAVWHGPQDNSTFAIAPSAATIQLPRSALRRASGRGCGVVQAAFDATGIAVLEGCPNAVTVPARLAHLDPDLHLSWSVSTGLCPNGATVVANRPGTDLLVTATTHCGGPPPVVDVIQTWSGPHAHEIARYTNPQQFVTAATW